MSDEEQNFLTRWSRRKAAARERAVPDAPPQETAPPPDAPAAAGSGVAPLSPVGAPPETAAGSGGGVPDVAAELPPIETLQGLASDYRAFFRRDVDQGLQRAALKKLFSDPHFNEMDGLDVYIDDYGIPDPIPPEMLADLKHARGLLFDDPVEEPVNEVAAGADETVSTQAAADATADADAVEGPQVAEVPEALQESAAASEPDAVARNDIARNDADGSAMRERGDAV